MDTGVFVAATSATYNAKVRELTAICVHITDGFLFALQVGLSAIGTGSLAQWTFTKQ